MDSPDDDDDTAEDEASLLCCGCCSIAPSSGGLGKKTRTPSTSKQQQQQQQQQEVPPIDLHRAPPIVAKSTSGKLQLQLVEASDGSSSSSSSSRSGRSNSGRSSSGRSSSGRSSSGRSSSGRSNRSGGSRNLQSSPLPKASANLRLRLNSQRPHASVHNSRGIAKKVRDRLKRGPSSKDEHGFIYVFHIKGDAHENYYKIGRTRRLPKNRIGEWPGAVVIKTWRVKRNRHAEVLVHWLLDVNRVYRYVVDTDATTGRESYLSVNKNTRIMCRDVTYRAMVHGKQSLATTGKQKRIEWFLVSRSVAIHVIDAVVQDINDHWRNEPWSEAMQPMK